MNGSKYSEEQVEWIDWLNIYDDVSAKFCHGSDEAIEFIKSFDQTMDHSLRLTMIAEADQHGQNYVYTKYNLDKQQLCNVL